MNFLLSKTNNNEKDSSENSQTTVKHGQNTLSKVALMEKQTTDEVKLQEEQAEVSYETESIHMCRACAVFCVHG